MQIGQIKRAHAIGHSHATSSHSPRPTTHTPYALRSTRLARPHAHDRFKKGNRSERRFRPQVGEATLVDMSPDADEHSLVWKRGSDDSCLLTLTLWLIVRDRRWVWEPFAHRRSGPSLTRQHFTQLQMPALRSFQGTAINASRFCMTDLLPSLGPGIAAQGATRAFFSALRH